MTDYSHTIDISEHEYTATPIGCHDSLVSSSLDFKGPLAFPTRFFFILQLRRQMQKKKEQIEPS